MPTFKVELIKTVSEKAWIEVEAADSEAAERAAIALTETDESVGAVLMRRPTIRSPAH